MSWQSLLDHAVHPAARRLELADICFQSTLTSALEPKGGLQALRVWEFRGNHLRAGKQHSVVNLHCAVLQGAVCGKVPDAVLDAPLDHSPISCHVPNLHKSGESHSASWPSGSAGASLMRVLEMIRLSWLTMIRAKASMTNLAEDQARLHPCKALSYMGTIEAPGNCEAVSEHSSLPWLDSKAQG